MARHLGIAIPCQDQVDSMFAKDMSQAVGFHAFTFPEDDITQNWHQSAFLAETRNVQAKALLEAGCSHIIMIDTDMQFPQDTFARLLAHDVPAVSVNCSKRRRPISPTARKEPEDRESNSTADLVAVWPDRKDIGGNRLERVAVVGAAIMCVKAEVFMQIPYPWFDTPYRADKDWFVGEDLYFCGLLKHKQIPLYIDHGLSWDVRHLGAYGYGMDDVLAERKAAEMGLWNHLAPDFKEPPKLKVVGE